MHGVQSTFHFTRRRECHNPNYNTFGKDVCAHEAYLFLNLSSLGSPNKKNRTVELAQVATALFKHFFKK